MQHIVNSPCLPFPHSVICLPALLAAGGANSHHN